MTADVLVDRRRSLVDRIPARWRTLSVILAVGVALLVGVAIGLAVSPQAPRVSGPVTVGEAVRACGLTDGQLIDGTLLYDRESTDQEALACILEMLGAPPTVQAGILGD